MSKNTTQKKVLHVPVHVTTAFSETLAAVKLLKLKIKLLKLEDRRQFCSMHDDLTQNCSNRLLPTAPV